MTTSVIRLALTTLALAAALAGCQPLEKNSKLRDTVMQEPDAAFMKRVKNDPFPSAGQAPKVATATPTGTAGTTKKPNVTVSVGGLATASDGTATASDDEQSTTATTAPLTARNNVRPLRKPTTTAGRRN